MVKDQKKTEKRILAYVLLVPIMVYAYWKAIRQLRKKSYWFDREIRRMRDTIVAGAVTFTALGFLLWKVLQ